MIRVEQLFISPGHNFYGHHGKPAGKNPIIAVDEVECVAGRGLRGDRFFDYEENYKGQITFFSLEVFDALRCELKLPEAQPSATRRNVFTRGADLNFLMGKEFEIQGIRFAGVCEAKPCYWMNTALGPGAEEWLKGRAGLRARILTNGILRREATDNSQLSGVVERGSYAGEISHREIADGERKNVDDSFACSLGCIAAAEPG